MKYNRKIRGRYPILEGDKTYIGKSTFTGTTTTLDVNLTSDGQDLNYYGIDQDIVQGLVCSGALWSRGNLNGIASTVSAIGNIDHVWPFYGSALIAMADDTEINQSLGGVFRANLTGTAHTLTIHGELVGMHAEVNVAADVTDVTGGTVAGAFIFANVLKNITSTVYGAYVQVHEYCDYGIAIMVEDSNATAGMYIQARGTSVLPVGLELGTKDTGSMTAAFAFPAAGTAPTVSNATAMSTLTSEGYIVVNVDGSAKKMYYFA